MTCSTGKKGRLKASNIEFEIVATTSTTSTIRYRGTRTQVEVEDEQLRKLAVGISEWGEKESE